MEYLHCLQINWPKCCTGAIFVCMLNYITANTVHSDFKCIYWCTAVVHNNTHTIANYSVSQCNSSCMHSCINHYICMDTCAHMGIYMYKQVYHIAIAS